MRIFVGDRRGTRRRCPAGRGRGWRGSAPARGSRRRSRCRCAPRTRLRLLLRRDLGEQALDVVGAERRGRRVERHHLAVHSHERRRRSPQRCRSEPWAATSATSSWLIGGSGRRLSSLDVTAPGRAGRRRQQPEARGYRRRCQSGATGGHAPATVAGDRRDEELGAAPTA